MLQYRQGSREHPHWPLNNWTAVKLQSYQPGTTQEYSSKIKILPNQNWLIFLKAQGHTAYFCYSSPDFSIYYLTEFQTALLLDLPGFQKYFLHEAPTHISNHGLTMACQSTELESDDRHTSTGMARHPFPKTHHLSVLKTPMYLEHAQSYKHAYAKWQIWSQMKQKQMGKREARPLSCVCVCAHVHALPTASCCLLKFLFICNGVISYFSNLRTKGT